MVNDRLFPEHFKVAPEAPGPCGQPWDMGLAGSISIPHFTSLDRDTNGLSPHLADT